MVDEGLEYAIVDQIKMALASLGETIDKPVNK